MNLSTDFEAVGALGAKILGDARRAARMSSMLRTLVRRPAGEVSKVFSRPAEQQGAYDFLEHDRVKAEAVQKVAWAATAQRCRGLKKVFCIIDGTSLTLTDEADEKGFGSVGTRTSGARGLKVINVLALNDKGQTIGILAQEIWVRPDEPVEEGYRPLEERESYRWHIALDKAHAILAEHAPGTQLHVLADREADASELIEHMLLELECEFTIRANGTRVTLANGRYVPLMPRLRRQPVVATLTVEVPRKRSRPKRMATLEVRTLPVQLRLRDRHTKSVKDVSLTVVWAYERRPPRGAERLNWLLYTTDLLETGGKKAALAAVAVVARYTRRWRIEEFHKTLKSGGGCVENSQLRSVQAVIKWATLHSIVASRAQRLRDLAKSSPDALASVELSDEEIEALVLLKSLEKRRTETVEAEGLTIARAVRWIGDLGGFAATGVSDKLPGPTVIGRGLERVLEAVTVTRALRAAGKIR